MTGVDQAEEPVAAGATSDSFDVFVSGVGARLRRVTCARFGLEVGGEAAADALAWAWEHWDEVQVMDNPGGYLYRVAQSKVRRYHRWQRPTGLPVEPRDGLD